MKNLNKKLGFAPLIMLLVIFGVLVAGGGVYYYQKHSEIIDISCTMEAKLCPDGSAVGRSGPKCEFPECPAVQAQPEVTTSTEKQIGYIKKVYEKDGKNYLDIDYVQYFTGNEAIKAKIEDKECTSSAYSDPSSCAPNGFYIRNINKQTRTFEVSNQAQVIIGSPATGSISLTGLKTYQFLDGSLFYIDISNNVITKITEQFIP